MGWIQGSRAAPYRASPGPKPRGRAEIRRLYDGRALNSSRAGHEERPRGRTPGGARPPQAEAYSGRTAPTTVNQKP